ncbi:MAG: Crp/Fnr family transcriptional regulator [Schleiferiaceae bacterium]|nr:Crp/Fnr family transcriptional regulator [Schleiferiaceae bacterium]
MEDKIFLKPAALGKYLPMLSHPDLLSDIIEKGRLKYFDAGDIVMDFGISVTSIPILLEGNLRVVRHDDEGRELLLYYLTEGQSCAASLQCCMNNKKSEVQAIAEEECTILFLPQEVTNDWIMQYPEWKDFIIRTYQSRFEDLLNTLDALAFSKLDERLSFYLQEKSRIHKDDTVHISHQDIANDLNSSREVISRLLKKMEQRGMLILGRNSIRLLDM